MSTKIPVTKQELIIIANSEFIKEPTYKSHLKITDVETLGNLLKFEILATSDEDLPLILNSQEFANKLSEKYVLIA